MNTDRLDKLGGLLGMTVIAMLCGYLLAIHQRNSFDMDKTHYEQAGVMEIHDGGKALYVPVFQKKSYARTF